MAFVGLLVVCDEEGEKFTSDGSVLHLQAGEKHLCSVVCPQELHPGFHNKALGSSVGSGCSHLLAPHSFHLGELRCRSSAESRELWQTGEGTG